MKHIVLLAVMLLIFASACFGADYEYAMYYGTRGDSVGGVKMSVASHPEATDGFDNEHARTTPLPTGILAGIHHTNGSSGWTGDTGFYANDVRPAPTQGTTSTINDIYVWATPGVTSQDMHLYFRMPPTFGADVTYKLTLLTVPNGVTYTGPMEWSMPHGDVVLPFYSTSDGTTGYKFKIEITAAQ